MTALYWRSLRAARVTPTNPIVVTAQAIHIQPRMPLYPSSIVPVITDPMPVGHSRTSTSNGHTMATQRTSSSSGARGMPGCTRYQCPRSMASVTAPRKAAPTTTRATDSAAGSPAEIPAATNPTSPMAGATRSRTGGNSGASASTAPRRRSMPVIAVTRALRASASARSPATPARRRCTETRSATPVATTTPTLATSRTGTESP